MFKLYYGWFSTWDDAGNQGGASVICTSEEDGLKHFDTVHNDLYLNDCGFAELEQNEVLELIQDFQNGITDEGFFTSDALKTLKKIMNDMNERMNEMIKYQVQVRRKLNGEWVDNDWIAVHAGTKYDLVDSIPEAEAVLVEIKNYNDMFPTFTYEYRIAEINFSVRYI